MIQRLIARFNNLHVRVVVLFVVLALLAVFNFLGLWYQYNKIAKTNKRHDLLVHLAHLNHELRSSSAEGAENIFHEMYLAEIEAAMVAPIMQQHRQYKRVKHDFDRLKAALKESEGKKDKQEVGYYSQQLTKRLQAAGSILKSDLEEAERHFWILLVVLCCMNLGALGVGYLLFRYVVIRPLAKIARVSEQISAGEEAEKLPYEQDDEIGAIAKALNVLRGSLQHARDFVVRIGQGKLDTVYEGINPEQEKGSRSLAGVLLGMQGQLRQIQQEEEKRRWAAEGLSHFAELFRREQESLEQLGNAFVCQLAQFLKINQAAFYLLEGEGEEVYCTLKACYAYNRKKYLNQQIQRGEGLLGQAWLEKDVIYLTEVPPTYAYIKSGLGGASPTAVLIVPLVHNDEVQGMLELASFKLLADYEIAFVQKLAETLAATLMAVGTNETTRRLLEESQQLTEQLRAQEEEMRQNMEEMAATQEEVHRRETEERAVREKLMARIGALDAAALMSESDLYGNFTYVNEKFCEVAKYRPEEVMGRPHSILRHPDNPKSLFREMWQTIKAGKVFKGTYPNRAKDGSTYWVDATIVPVLDEHGKPVKYIGVRFDITEQVQRELQYKEGRQEQQDHLAETALND